MEKRTLYIIIAIILVAALVLTFYGNLTGQSTLGASKGKCIDSDNGNNKYVKGSASYENRAYKYTDYCYARGGFGEEVWLKEYFCLEKIESKTYRCYNGCVDGACIRE